MAAAVYLHNALFTGNPNDDSDLPLRQDSNQLDRDQIGDEQLQGRNVAPFPLIAAAPPHQLYSSQRSRSAPNLNLNNQTRTTVATSLSFPTSSDPLRPQRPRSPHRLQWTILRFILSCVLFIWSTYTTIRYWLAFSVFQTDTERRRYALSLGIIASFGSGALVLDLVFAAMIQSLWVVYRRRRRASNDVGMSLPTIRSKRDSEQSAVASPPPNIPTKSPSSIPKRISLEQPAKGSSSIDQTLRPSRPTNAAAGHVPPRPRTTREVIRQSVHVIHWLAYLSLLLVASINLGIYIQWKDAATVSEASNLVVYSPHAIAGRCHFDVDAVWNGVSSFDGLTVISPSTLMGPISSCERPIPFGIFILGAVLRLIITMGVGVGFHVVEMKWWRRLKPSRPSSFVMVKAAGPRPAGVGRTLSSPSIVTSVSPTVVSPTTTIYSPPVTGSQRGSWRRSSGDGGRRSSVVEGRRSSLNTAEGSASRKGVGLEAVPESETAPQDDEGRTYPESERPASRLSKYENGGTSRSSYSYPSGSEGVGGGRQSFEGAGRSSFEFGQTRILGAAPRWADDPNFVDSEDGSAFDSQRHTPLSASITPDLGRASSPYGPEVRIHTPTNEGDDSSPTGWVGDFRQIVGEDDRPAFLSQDPMTMGGGVGYQHPLAQGIQLSMGRGAGEFWDREVRMLGGVVRRMSTIESLGSHERELAEASRRGSAGTTGVQRRGSGSGGTTTGGSGEQGGNGNGANGGDVIGGARATSPTSVVTRTSSRASRTSRRGTGDSPS